MESKKSILEIELPTAIVNISKTKETIAIALFNEHLLTKNEAADMIGITLPEFHKILLNKSIPLNTEHTPQDILDIYESALDDCLPR